jgi:hypothetical protein
MEHADTARRAHVSRTRRHLDADLQLDRLLALTYGHATPGNRALALVVRIIDPSLPPRWEELARTGLATDTVLTLADRLAEAFRTLPAWSAAALEGLLEALAPEAGTTPQALRQAVSVFVLRAITPLPVPEVLELIGRDECLRRLLEGRRSYQACQLVG